MEIMDNLVEHLDPKADGSEADGHSWAAGVGIDTVLPC